MSYAKKRAKEKTPDKKKELKDYFSSLHSITKEQDTINLTIIRLIDDSTDPRWRHLHMMDAANAIILEISSSEGYIGNPEYVKEKMRKLDGYYYEI